jgi:ubiquinone/menaquinone biosynthesis C-methylase UbiE
MTRDSSTNLFRAAAWYFDLGTENLSRDDIPFYLDYASRPEGDVLELACGTGRVAIPLAEAGHTVWGLDFSREMLDQFQEKLKERPRKIEDRITLLHQNMAEFSINRTFSLIILAFRSFQSLTEEKDQLSCLESIRRHLTQSGSFIINVFKPREPMNESWISDEVTNLETEDPRTGAHVRRTHVQRKIDLKNQIIYPDLIYYIIHPDGTKERLAEPLTLKYYFEDQMRTLLLEAGFTIKEEMGYYDKRPISQGPELIFVCGRG